jgi:hypothetical protein
MLRKLLKASIGLAIAANVSAFSIPADASATMRTNKDCIHTGSCSGGPVQWACTDGFNHECTSDEQCACL